MTVIFSKLSGTTPRPRIAGSWCGWRCARTSSGSRTGRRWPWCRPDRVGAADIVARQAGVVAGHAGGRVTTSKRWARSLTLEPRVGRRQPIAAGDRVATTRGQVRDLLTCERILLNLLGRLMGVATLAQPVRRAYRRDALPRLRHAQDDARLAAAGKVRRALRRRPQSSHRALRRGADQGQPPRPVRRPDGERRRPPRPRVRQARQFLRGLSWRTVACRRRSSRSKSIRSSNSRPCCPSGPTSCCSTT